MPDPTPYAVYQLSAAQMRDINAIKVSVATAATAQAYPGDAALDGALVTGGVAFTTHRAPQAVTATSSANVGSYVAASVITITGTLRGQTVTGTMTVVGTDGGESLITTQAFDSITLINVAAQADAGGLWQFGVADVILTVVSPAVQVRHGTAGNINLNDYEGNTRVLVGAAAEKHDLKILRVFGASTTSTPITIYRGKGERQR